MIEVESLSTQLQSGVTGTAIEMRKADVVELTRETVSSGKGVLVVEDLDGTTSFSHKPWRPFETNVDRRCAWESRRLAEAGVVLATLSDRGTNQLSRIYRGVPGQQERIMVGSYGHESRLPGEGAKIHDRWDRYNNAITRVLCKTREAIFTHYGMDNNVKGGNVVIENEGLGMRPIYLEMRGKGAVSNGNIKWNEGLAHTYYLGELSLSEREQIVDKLYHVSESCFESCAEQDIYLGKLRSRWGSKSIDRLRKNVKQANFTFSLRPKWMGNKAAGMLSLVNEVAVRNTHVGNEVGLVIFAGDHVRRDGAAMEAGRLIENAGAGIKFVGVQVAHDEEVENRNSNLTVKGVKGYARFLNSLNGVISSG